MFISSCQFPSTTAAAKTSYHMRVHRECVKYLPVNHHTLAWCVLLAHPLWENSTPQLHGYPCHSPHTSDKVSQQSHLHTGWVPVCAALHIVTPTAGCCLLTVSSRKSKASRMTFVSFQPHFCCWCFHSKITFMLLSIFVLLLIPFSSFVSEVPCSTPYFL